MSEHYTSDAATHHYTYNDNCFRNWGGYETRREHTHTGTGQEGKLSAESPPWNPPGLASTTAVAPPVPRGDVASTAKQLEALIR